MDAPTPRHRSPSRSDDEGTRALSGRWPSPMSPGGPSTHVEVQCPNRDRFALLPRLTGTALASGTGFSMAELDDLRRGLDGIWSVLSASTAPGTVLHFGFDSRDRSLQLEACSRTDLPVTTPTGQPATSLDVHLDVTWEAAAPRGRW